MSEWFLEAASDNAVCPTDDVLGDPDGMLLAPLPGSVPVSASDRAMHRGCADTRAPNDVIASQANHTSGSFPAEANEFELSGLTQQPSTMVAPPRVAEAAVQLECKLDMLHEVYAFVPRFTPLQFLLPRGYCKASTLHQQPPTPTSAFS